jgi:hypothetical protein
LFKHDKTTEALKIKIVVSSIIQAEIGAILLITENVLFAKKK